MAGRTAKAGVLALGNSLGTVVGLALAIILARVLSKSDYATYRQTILTFALVCPLLALGLPQALLYFIPLDPKRAKGILTECLTMLAGFGLLFSCFLLLGGQHWIAARFDNPDLARSLSAYAIFPLAFLPTLALPPCLIARDQIAKSAIYSLAFKLAFFALVLTAALVWQTGYAAVVARSLAAVLICFPGIAMMYKACRGTAGAISSEGFKRILFYSVPLGLAVGAGTLSTNLDKLIVSTMSEPESFAVYVNGAMEVPFIGMVSAAVAAILLPELAALHKKGKMSEGVPLWNRAAVKCSLLFFPIAAFLFVCADDLMVLLYSEKYAESAAPFRIYALILPVRIVQYGTVFQAAGKTGQVLIRTLLALVVNVVVSVLLVLRFGYLGAAIGTLLTTYFFAVPYNLVSISRIMGVSISRVLPYGTIGLVTLASGLPAAAVGIAYPLLDGLAIPVRLGVAFAVFAVLVAVAFHFFRLQTFDQQMAHLNSLKSRISKRRR